MSTQVVILAGGLGTRLRPLTYDIPKPMVPVAGKPFLEHQILMLRDQGITDVVLLIGYLGFHIQDHFGDGSRFGVSIRYSVEQTPAGTGGGLMLARPLLAEQFLVVYGDSFLPIHYPAVMDALLQSTYEGVLVAYGNDEDTDVKPNLALGEDGKVLLYLKDTADPRLGYVEAGVSALRRKALDLLPGEGPFSLEMTLFPRLIARGSLGAVTTSQRFYDIGTPGRLEDIRRFLR